MRLLALCIFTVAALTGAEVSGKWRGSIQTEMAAQTTGGEIPAYMELQQVDGKVTGSAGGSEKMLFKIREGTIEGDRLTVVAFPKDDSELRFILRVKDDVLEGEVQENGRTIGSAKLTRE